MASDNNNNYYINSSSSSSSIYEPFNTICLNNSSLLDLETFVNYDTYNSFLISKNQNEFEKLNDSIDFNLSLDNSNKCYVDEPAQYTNLSNSFNESFGDLFFDIPIINENENENSSSSQIITTQDAEEILNINLDSIRLNDENQQFEFLITGGEPGGVSNQQENDYFIFSSSSSDNKESSESLNAENDDDHHDESSSKNVCIDRIENEIDNNLSQIKLIKKNKEILKKKQIKTKECYHVWEFCRDLLKNENHLNKTIKWLDEKKGIFKILDPINIAKLWGINKNIKNMKYPNMARGIRYSREEAGYFDLVTKDHGYGKKLVYKFGKKALKSCEWLRSIIVSD